MVDGLRSREVCLLLPTSSDFLFMMGVVEDCKSFEDASMRSLVFFGPDSAVMYCPEISIETGYPTEIKSR
jgi:hypothetical protein